MAGVKGRSGGPRKGAGGPRPGAGRKPKAVAEKSANKRAGTVRVELEPQVHGGQLKRSRETPAEIPDCDMLKLLQDVALGRVEASPVQVRAAIAAVQYTHVKKGDGGKKEAKQDAADKAVTGRFAPKAPPRLVVNNR